jgi:predicted NAD/FAD-binding protein
MAPIRLSSASVVSGGKGVRAMRPKVMVIGGGISGISATAHLEDRCDVTLLEASRTLGGHVRTVPVDTPIGTVAVDMGFIVFNERNYPVLCSLFDRWGVPSQPSLMSFSVTTDDLCFSGQHIGGLFAAPGSVRNPTLWRLVRDVWRFGRLGTEELAQPPTDDPITIGAWVAAHGFGDRFVDAYLVPLGASVWSADPRHFLKFPARRLLRFLDNHGLLRFRDRPRWRTVVGGSATYVDAFRRATTATIRESCAALSVRRVVDGVEVETERGIEMVDAVVLACHAPTAAALLSDPSATEARALGALRTQDNDVVLHRDATLMPPIRRAWASWNYASVAGDGSRPTLTYWMDQLQALPGDPGFFVSLNQTEAIDPATVVARATMAHPVYDLAAQRAVDEIAAVQGQRRTYYCGAWTGYGFHEDGASSGASVARALVAALS